MTEPFECSDQSGRAISANGELTKRERQVLELIGNGLGNGEIAERLYIGKRTVETHIRHIYAKLALSSRAQAILYAIRAGMVSID